MGKKGIIRQTPSPMNCTSYFYSTPVMTSKKTTRKMLDTREPTEVLRDLIRTRNESGISDYIESLSAPETARAISRLPEAEQHLLFSLLSPEDAADVIEDVSDAQAAEMVENMPVEQAAAIMEELDSDHLADLLGEMDDRVSESILSRMEKGDAEEARIMLKYAPDSAGGLMISEYLAFRADNTIQDVLNDLQANHEEYNNYNVQYFYVVDQRDKLTGVLRMHNLLFPPGKRFLAK